MSRERDKSAKVWERGREEEEHLLSTNYMQNPMEGDG